MTEERFIERGVLSASGDSSTTTLVHSARRLIWRRLKGFSVNASLFYFCLLILKEQPWFMRPINVVQSLCAKARTLTVWSGTLCIVAILARWSTSMIVALGPGFSAWPSSRWARVSRCLLKQRMMEVVVTTGLVTTGAIRHAKLQTDHHHQQTNIKFFTGRMPFLSPNQQCRSTEAKQRPGSLDAIPAP